MDKCTVPPPVGPNRKTITFHYIGSGKKQTPAYLPRSLAAGWWSPAESNLPAVPYSTLATEGTLGCL